MNRNNCGFTLTELFLAVTIISAISAVVIPKIGRTIVTVKQSVAKGNLGAFRSALSIYYADNTGTYPYDNLASLTTGGKYLGSMPWVTLPQIGRINPGHAPSNRVCTAGAGGGCAPDLGGWVYQNVNPYYTDPGYGTHPWGYLAINCIHRDSKGQLWYLQ